mgnify:CR=1 FL=1
MAVYICDCGATYRCPAGVAVCRHHDRLKTLVAELAGALRFYAAPETYFAVAFFADPPCGDFMNDFEELSGDLGHPDGTAWVKPGKRARTALNRAKEIG